MKDKIILIHISDLHVYLKDDGFEEASKNFFFNTKSLEHEIHDFISYVSKSVSDSYCNYEKYLIISGDITDIGHKKEFIKASEIIEKLIAELKIDKSKILVVPGDHDISRNALMNEYELAPKENRPIDPNVKFDNFYNFYKNFFKVDEFDKSNIIVNILNLEHLDISLIGLNSCHKIGNLDGYGYIDVTRLREELATKKLMNNKIFVFHHNLISVYDKENNTKGQWDSENHSYFIKLISDNEVKICLFGNEHTNSITTINNLQYSDSGSFFCKDNLPATFKIYEYLNDDQKSVFKVKAFINDNFKRNTDTPNGIWGPRTIVDTLHNNNNELIIKVKNSNKNITTNLIELIENSHLNLTKYDIKKEEPRNMDREMEESHKKEKEDTSNSRNNHNLFTVYNQKLINIVKKENLFHSGHYHWSDSSRAHNWIDVTKMLQNYENLSIARNGILSLIEKNSLIRNTTHLISLGQEGNLLSSYLILKYGLIHSYLPYSYRYQEHSDHEKELNFNEEIETKEIIILSDVVHDGKTVANLLLSNSYKDYFAKFDRIHIVSLFYTGTNPSNVIDTFEQKNELTNSNIESSNSHDSKKAKAENEYAENFHAGNEETQDLVAEIMPNDSVPHSIESIETKISESKRYTFNYVCEIKVEPCPYKDDEYKEKCILISQGLGCVHYFYKTSEALERLKNIENE